MHQNCVHFVMETQKRLFTRAVSLQSVAMCALAVQFVNFVLRSGGGALCTLGNGNTKGGLQSRGANRRNQGGGEDNASFTPTVCTTKSVMHSWGGIGRASYSQQEHKVSWSCWLDNCSVKPSDITVSILCLAARGGGQRFYTDLNNQQSQWCNALNDNVFSVTAA